jgi:hypothetical protein
VMLHGNLAAHVPTIRMPGGQQLMLLQDASSLQRV